MVRQIAKVTGASQRTMRGTSVSQTAQNLSHLAQTNPHGPPTG